MVVREKYLSQFVLTERDFKGNLEAYNNYLEMVEDFCFNLVHKIDVKETERRIEEYIEANKALITNAQQARRREMEDSRMDILEQERYLAERRAAAIRERDQSKVTAALRNESMLGQMISRSQFSVAAGGMGASALAMATDGMSSTARKRRPLASDSPVGVSGLWGV